MSTVYKYEDLVNKFNNQLVDKLRLHGNENEALSLWVPNDDLFKSFQNLISALKETNVNNFKISFLKKSLYDSFIEDVHNFYKNDLVFSYHDDENRIFFNINKIQDSSHKGNKLQDGQAKEFVVNTDYLYGEIYVKEMPKALLPLIELYSNKNNFYQSIDHSNDKFYETVGNNELEIGILFDKNELKILNFEYCFKDLQSINRKLKAVCEMAGEIAIGLPVKEFCEHISLKVINNFIKHSPDFIKPAIILPNNIGAEFMLFHKLIQSLYIKVANKLEQIKNNINFYDTPPKKSWLNLLDDLRFKKIKECIKEFEKQNNFKEEVIQLKEIKNDLDGWPIRVTVSFSIEIEIPERPKILRNLETYLRDSLEKVIQIFYEESKDKSKIRRL